MNYSKQSEYNSSGRRKNNMAIGAVLQGGWGNILFQIANIEYLGYKYGHDVVYYNPKQWIDNSVNNSVLGWSPNADKISEVFPHVDIFKNQDRRLELETQVQCPFRYKEIIPKDKFIYDGYFQSEQFFPDKKFITNLFEFSDKMWNHTHDYGKELLMSESCSIHVRRGNYLLQQQYHPVMDMDYYNKAIDFMEENLKIDYYFVFTNDIRWCRKNFTGSKFIIIQNQDYVEFFLQSVCTHHIIANSSFSWWASYLSENDNTVVVCPRKWFGSALPPNEDEDIIPKRWIRL